MSILTLASFGTSPGVTTTAVAMTMSWTRPVLLVEADVSKPSAVLSGWMQGSLPADSGLMGVAQSSFQRVVSDQDVWDYAVELSPAQGGSPARWLLPAIAQPRAARGMRSLWPDLLAALRLVSAQDVDVIIDTGRAEEAYGRHPLWSDSDHLGVVVRSDLTSVAAVRSYLPTLAQARMERGAADTTSLIVVEDRAQKLPSKDISKVLDTPVRGRLPYSPEAAAHFGGGAGSRARTRAFTRSISALNAALGDALRARQELIQKDETTEEAR